MWRGGGEEYEILIHLFEEDLSLFGQLKLGAV